MTQFQDFIKLDWRLENGIYRSYFHDKDRLVSIDNRETGCAIAFADQTGLYSAVNVGDLEYFHAELNSFPPSKNIEVVKEQIQAHLSVDFLTKLPNRRVMYGILDNEIEKTRDGQYIFSFLFSDIDYLMIHNDAFGHDKGDEAINTVASIIKGALRPADVLCRFGGDEFAVILPETDLQDALALSKKIEQDVSAYPFPVSEEHNHRRIGLSIGAVCSNETNAADWQDVLNLADTRVYNEKARKCGFPLLDERKK